MHDDGRFIPPGPGRQAAFAKRGGFPKSPLLSLGCSISIVCAFFFFWKNHFLFGLKDGFRAGIENATVKKAAVDVAVRDALLEGADWIIPVLFAALIGFTAVALISAAISRKNKGTTANPLPEVPKARLPIAMIRLFAASVFVVSALLVVRRTLLDVSISGAIAPIAGIWTALFRVLAILGLVLLLAGAAEVLVLRHQIYRSLFLNLSEGRRELQAMTSKRTPLSPLKKRLRDKVEVET